MKFKAAILVEQKKDLVIDEIESNSLEYGQVLVQIHYSGICGSQIGEIDGVKGPDPYLPHLLGHEAGGVVQEVGPGVKTVAPGDHVVMHWRPGSGIQAPTPTYNWNGKTVNAGWVTTFSDYSVISENRVTKIPADLDLKIAALYGCAIPTGYGVICNDAKVCIGESVVVFGAGGVGVATILAAKLAGAYPIVAVDVYDHKLEKAKDFGATHVCNSKTSSVPDLINKLLPGGADVVIDNTGLRPVREQAYGLTSKTGRTILVGVPKTPGEEMSIASLPLHFSKSITGSFGGDIQADYHLPRFIRFHEHSDVDLAAMITDCYPLDQVNDAITAMRGGEVIRCSLEMTAANG